MGLTRPLPAMLPLLVLALAAAATAQTPTPCEGPETFTARFRHFDRERGYYVKGKMFFDRINRRVREFEEFDINKTESYYDRLKLYNLNTEYSVDLKTRNCTVYTPRHYHPWGVPPDFKYVGAGTAGVIGLSQESVVINVWAGQFQDRNETVEMAFTVTSPDCFPVEHTYKYGSGNYEHREFYDMVAGITDPGAFVPPRRACVPANRHSSYMHCLG